MRESNTNDESFRRGLDLMDCVEAVVRRTQRISLSNGAVSNGGIPKDECYVQIDDL